MTTRQIWSTIAGRSDTFSSLIPVPRFASTGTRWVSTSTSTLPNQPSSSDSQTLLLPDGRTLGYATYGPQSGYPLMFFHGFPSSRLEAHVLDPLAHRLNTRIIAPDRPGFGLSTYKPHRRITDWPDDIRVLADHLGLTRFAVLGGSGGGPYALACANADSDVASIPNGRLSAVGIMAGAPPWEAGSHYMPLFSRVASSAAIYFPTVTAALMNLLVRVLRWGLNISPVTRRIDEWLAKAEAKSKEEAGPKATASTSDTTNISERRKRLLGMLFEPFAQGSKATLQEAQLLTQNWGLRFEDITYDKIQVWHGAKDSNAPVQMIRYMAEQIGSDHCVLKEYEDDTHFTLFRHLEEIVAGLVPKQQST